MARTKRFHKCASTSMYIKVDEEVDKEVEEEEEDDSERV